MRVWYQFFIFGVSGIGLANKIIKIAKSALGISEQNFQKTAIVPWYESVCIWTSLRTEPLMLDASEEVG